MEAQAFFRKAKCERQSGELFNQQNQNPLNYQAMCGTDTIDQLGSYYDDRKR
jgi:hypothetical protein